MNGAVADHRLGHLQGFQRGVETLLTASALEQAHVQDEHLLALLPHHLMITTHPP